LNSLHVLWYILLQTENFFRCAESQNLQIVHSIKKLNFLRVMEVMEVFDSMDF